MGQLPLYKLEWPEVRQRYRNLLCGREPGLALLEAPASGKPEFLDVLLQHNPAFEDGRLIGSAEFVAQQIKQYCDKFSRRRRRSPAHSAGEGRLAAICVAQPPWLGRQTA